MSIEVNFSRDIDYNRQRDNTILPFHTCGPTSMAMALHQAGYTNWVIPGEDPADTITKHLTTDRAFERMYNVLGRRDTSWRPFNIHAVLTWGINDLLGATASNFRTDWDLRNILFNIVKRGGAVLSGDFVLADGRELGHMVSLAGFTTRQQNILSVQDPMEIKIEDIENYIIDDPYGEYPESKFANHCGNDIKYSPELFNEIFRNRNSNRKWAHVIIPRS